MKQQLPLRKDVPVEQTWNLEDIFENEDAYQESLDKFQSLGKDFQAKYEGHIKQMSSVSELDACFDEYNEVITHYSRLSNYAFLDTTTDMTNGQSQNRAGTLTTIGSQVLSSLSFVDSELILLSDDLLKAAIKESTYSRYFEDILKVKPHMLGAESEMILAALSPVLNLPENGYQITKLSDMVFDDFEVDGVTYPLSFVQFENSYQLASDTKVRRGAFKQFHTNLKTYENTIANYYNTQIKKEKILASLRGYESVFDYLLDQQDVKPELYHRQIDVIMEFLAPHMRRYAQKLKNKLGVETLMYSDLKTPYLADQVRKISFTDAQKLSVEALGILGEKYQAIVQRAFDERWFDWASNLGKSTGGFCADVPLGHPYILLSWNEQLSEVFTIVHELGHAVQGVLTEERYPKVLQNKMSRYTIEAPSTFNEMLLSHHLLANSEDSNLKEWVAASMIENTYYHNFVTHFMEAAYQREVYRLVDQGVDLQADDFSRLFKEQLEKFWGESVELDEGAELTWMRQPHYYDGLYSYTYSAGLTISTVMSQRVFNEGQPAVDKWLNVLADCEVLKPVEFAASIDIDITTDQPLKETIAYIGSLVDELN